MQTINIKIASDVVCPWCYVGKKELEIAMEELKNDFRFEVQFLPYELAPDMPIEGEDFRTHITAKYGDWNKFLERSTFLEERGKTLGINFSIKDLGISPNTFLMHRIIQFAYQSGIQSKVKEAYMRAYFEEFVDLTDLENVVRIAAENGMDEEQVRALINGNEGEEEVRALQENLRALGISGVPFFIINDQYGISGAVPAKELIAAFNSLK